MNKWVLVMVLAVMSVAAVGVRAEDAPAKSTTVGGGVPNPWRSPYKTVLTSTPLPAAVN